MRDVRMLLAALLVPGLVLLAAVLGLLLLVVS